MHTSRGNIAKLPACALAAALALCCAGCGSGALSTPDGSIIGGTAEEQSAQNTAQSPYDWDNLVKKRGRLSHIVSGMTLSRTGIDVSQNQKRIDWKAVAKDGIDFAFVRLGYRGSTKGALYLDERFEYNVEHAQAAGLDVGVYFFSQAKTVKEAKEEARFALDALDGRELEYPIVFDSERVEGGGRTAGLSVEKLTKIARAFCKSVRAQGYAASIYGNARDMARYDLDALADYDLWYAQYADEPSSPLAFQIWQYSDKGKVKGIDAKVDLDIDLSAAL